MQVPEKLALIGGSILLASTLVFTLKSQASQILPKISDASNKIFDDIGDTQSSDRFDNDFKHAQHHGLQTGMWGTSKYYIDNDRNLHIGQGKINGIMANALGSKTVSSLNSINFDSSVQAPQDSYHLLSGLNNNTSNNSVKSISNLQNLNVSQVKNMDSMFSNYTHLKSLNLSYWNVSNVKTMQNMFMNTTSLEELNTAGWHAPSLISTENTFSNVPIHPDISTWHLNHSNTDNVFDP